MSPAPAQREFHCPLWPGCQCPDGTVALDCPGRTITVSPGPNEATGGPSSAPNMASPAAQEIDPDEAVTDFRKAMDRGVARAIAEATSQRRGRTISGETLIADINVLLARCDKSILEISAIQTELAMILNDMGQLHGLPVVPLARKAT